MSYQYFSVIDEILAIVYVSVSRRHSDVGLRVAIVFTAAGAGASIPMGQWGHAIQYL